jgi:acetyltransferase-like isoleucine patch superfamily enzyme
MADVLIGHGLHADLTAVLGYPAARGSDACLVVGRDARLRSGTMVYEGTRIGDRLETGHNVVIREGCTLGDDVSIWTNTVVDYGCRIGDRVKIHANCYVAQYTEIEDDAFLAPGVTIANDLYPGDPASAKMMSGPVIGAGAHIGVNVTILPFVRIGEGALIGAGAVVVRDVPPGRVAFGNPAVVRGTVDELASIAERVTPVTTSVSRFRRAVDVGRAVSRSGGRQ